MSETGRSKVSGADALRDFVAMGKALLTPEFHAAGTGTSVAANKFCCRL
jgi:hypothetical protein